MTDLELLRRFVAQGMPVRLVTAEDFKGAQALAAMGYVKMAMPPMKKGKETYGKQAPALVVAITTAGKRAIAD